MKQNDEVMQGIVDYYCLANGDVMPSERTISRDLNISRGVIRETLCIYKYLGAIQGNIKSKSVWLGE